MSNKELTIPQIVDELSKLYWVIDYFVEDEITEKSSTQYLGMKFNNATLLFRFRYDNELWLVCERCNNKVYKYLVPIGRPLIKNIEKIADIFIIDGKGKDVNNPLMNKIYHDTLRKYDNVNNPDNIFFQNIKSSNTLQEYVMLILFDNKWCKMKTNMLLIHDVWQFYFKLNKNNELVLSKFSESVKGSKVSGSFKHITENVINEAYDENIKKIIKKIENNECQICL